MKFIRLDKNTIRCVLTKEDLDAHGVNMTDFVEHNQSAKELIDYLLEESMKELDYKRTGEMISINVTPLSESSIALTFSDASNELREMVKHLVAMAKALNLDKEPTSDFDKKVKDKILDTELNKITSKINGDNSAGVYKAELDYFAYQFKSLNDVIAYVKALDLGDNPIVAVSNLYRCSDGDGYYLTVIKGATSQREFNYMGITALEFGKLISANMITQASMHEHNELVIQDKALDTLNELIGELYGND